MTRARVLGFAAAVLLNGATLPAMAAWDRIGSVDVSRFDHHSTQFIGDRGRMDQIDLQARGNDVMCDRVLATFGNGRTRDVFHGYIRQGQRVALDLPGRARNVNRLDFDCRPINGRFARLTIGGDLQQYGYNDRYNRRDGILGQLFGDNR